MQASSSVILSFDNRKIKAPLQFCPEATARVFEALTPYADDEFCRPDFENIPRDDSELNTPDDSPPPSSPASSPSMVPERCSSDSCGNQVQFILPEEEDNEEQQLVELLLFVKKTDIVDSDSALESKFFSALKPKESPSQKRILKYEFVSHTCEEHRKKHLRCPFNCKGRIVSRVPKYVSEDQLSDSMSIEEFELEGQASPISQKVRNNSRSSSGAEKDAMDTDDEDYSIESPKTKQRKETKKRQAKIALPRVLQNSFEEMPNRGLTQKINQEKDRIKKDREDRVRARRIAAIRESLKALEHSYDEESDVERVMSEQVQWLQDDKLFHEQNEKIINGKKKQIGAKNEGDASIFSGISVAVNSNAVHTTTSTSSTTSSSSSEDSTKGRRWVRFACERHRKEHAKCPENCPNRLKQEVSVGNSDADKREPQGIAST